MEILLEELSLLGNEDTLQDLIDLSEVPHLNHAICLVYHQILE